MLKSVINVRGSINKNTHPMPMSSIPSEPSPLSTVLNAIDKALIVLQPSKNNSVVAGVESHYPATTCTIGTPIIKSLDLIYHFGIVNTLLARAENLVFTEKASLCSWFSKKPLMPQPQKKYIYLNVTMIHPGRSIYRLFYHSVRFAL